MKTVKHSKWLLDISAALIFAVLVNALNLVDPIWLYFFGG